MDDPFPRGGSADAGFCTRFRWRLGAGERRGLGRLCGASVAPALECRGEGAGGAREFPAWEARRRSRPPPRDIALAVVDVAQPRLQLRSRVRREVPGNRGQKAFEEIMPRAADQPLHSWNATQIRLTRLNPSTNAMSSTSRLQDSMKDRADTRAPPSQSPPISESMDDGRQQFTRSLNVPRDVHICTFGPFGPT